MDGMKKPTLRIILAISLVLVLISNTVPIQAASSDDGKTLTSAQVILKNGYVAKLIGRTNDGKLIYQADFGAPSIVCTI